MCDYDGDGWIDLGEYEAMVLREVRIVRQRHKGQVHLSMMSWLVSRPSGWCRLRGVDQ